MLDFIKSIFQSKPIDYPDLLSRKALIVDVRGPGEFAQGNVNGSLNIPLNELSKKIYELQKQGKPVIACCRSGARSKVAAAMMERSGIEAYNGGSWNRVQTALSKI